MYVRTRGSIERKKILLCIQSNTVMRSLLTNIKKKHTEITTEGALFFSAY